MPIIENNCSSQTFVLNVSHTMGIFLLPAQIVCRLNLTIIHRIKWKDPLFVAAFTVRSLRQIVQQAPLFQTLHYLNVSDRSENSMAFRVVSNLQSYSKFVPTRTADSDSGRTLLTNDNALYAINTVQLVTK